MAMAIKIAPTNVPRMGMAKNGHPIKSIIQPDLLLVEGVVVSCDISIAPYAYAEMEKVRGACRAAHQD